MPQRRRFAKKQDDVRRFRLVARSQNDGNADDPDATPLVLEPCIRPNDIRRSGLSPEELLSTPASLSSKFPDVFADSSAPRMHGDSDDEEGEEGDGGEEDLDGDCYFPKDGYNYEKHLKRVSGTGKGGGGVVGVVVEAKERVPEKEVKVQKPSNTEEEEVMRALELADEYDELEDGALDELIPGGVVEADVQIWGPSAKKDTNLPDLALFKAMHQARIAGMGSLLEGGEDEEDEEGEGSEEGESQAGESNSAAQRPRRRKKAAVAERPMAAAAPSAAEASAAEFEEFFALEYGEDADVGALSDEELEGPMAAEKAEEVADEYIEEMKREKEHLTSIYEPQKRQERLDDVPRVIDETKAIIEQHYSREVEGEDDDDTSSGEEHTEESRTWDCESVLSTLSNLSNRPGRIGKIKLIKKPEPAMKSVQEQDEAESEESDVEGIVELPDVVTERKKDETPEEKKQRKAAVKEMRRICRQMKKESKDTYKSEAAKLPCNKPGTGDVRFKSRTFRL
mmetsp:Transcript_129279/g.374326  ORF Transcript_129279/g.374326 Transcript_129279/m.374326 type:complete len:510 (-) Transcript_129279:230-1759(-)|eukprot:CAMPEP_0176074804 /NCGR_PEP_ID=MMETSP0120_2-20121206/37384_1 /TAXON_ID=160619 /ORGANISM="Kryptoperidinium foliaceum, Strain CCMP 1326" /LENGTH=509 /DNA_ID=CAMNT_0017408501 /DNA_START=69 /DNA_END=1598 /DNA_ORIENTATION=-